MVRRAVMLGFLLGLGAMGSRASEAQPIAREIEPAPVRVARRFSIGLGLTWPLSVHHDVTVPLPTARVGVNLSPRLSLDLTTGGIKYGYDGRWTLVDLGGRWFFRDGHVSPYAMARIGEYFDKSDEGSDTALGYGMLGGGLEWTCGCGLLVWGEGGVGFVRSQAPAWDSGARYVDAGLYASLGLGYRFGI